ncbi:unnamed protein product [Calicophoron daubneyi]|uniref:Histone deacetylase domain-containing protein n=1 Tax=Calicophoron daubneyi TaxID=300641 RepID=A0AAV2TUS3_CALDB
MTQVPNVHAKMSADKDMQSAQPSSSSSPRRNKAEIIPITAKKRMNTNKRKTTKEFLPHSRSTGLVYDERMTMHKHEWLPTEQECPARIQRAWERCVEEGLVSRCVHVPVRHASEDALSLIHTKSYIRHVKQSRNFGPQELYDLSAQYDGVFFNQFTWNCATLAAGGLKHLTDMVVRGRLANGLALIRPPGHHAMKEEACGYCIINSVAFTAASFLSSPPKGAEQATILAHQSDESTSVTAPTTSRTKHMNKSEGDMQSNITQPDSTCSATIHSPTLTKTDDSFRATGSKSRVVFDRILIIDWDVHHGQGTQYAFYNDNRVLYISIHRYQRRRFWPNLRESNFDFIGEGDGRGYNINIPLDDTGMCDSDYLAVFHHLIMPIALEFNPELVLVSCGFDPAVGDPEGRMWLTPPVFGHFVNQLKILAGGKLVVSLEGGYYVDSLAESAVHVLKALLGDYSTPVRLPRPPCKSIKRTIDSCIKALRAHWKSLWIQDISRTVRRPKLDHLPLISWHFVKQVIWPEANPQLPHEMASFARRLMQRHIPMPVPPPSSGRSVLLFAPTFLPGTSNSVVRSSTKGSSLAYVWSRELLRRLHGCFDIQFYQCGEVTNPSNKGLHDKRRLTHSKSGTPPCVGKCQKVNESATPSSSMSDLRRNSCSTGNHRVGDDLTEIESTNLPDTWLSNMAHSVILTPSAAIRKALVTLLSHQYNQVLLAASEVNSFQLVEAVTELPPKFVESYRELLMKTRSGGQSYIELSDIQTNSSSADFDQSVRINTVVAEAKTVHKVQNTDSHGSEVPTLGTMYSPTEPQAQSYSQSMTAFRLFVVDLSEDKEPDLGINLRRSYSHQAGGTRCTLVWCSLHRGSHVEHSAMDPASFRAVQKNSQARSVELIRNIYWLKIPVLGSGSQLHTASPTSSNDRTMIEDLGPNLLAAVFHILLPLAYEYAPDVICLRIGKGWIEQVNSQTTIPVAQLVHLLSGLGHAFLICFASSEPPSTDIFLSLLGHPPSSPLDRSESFAPTSKMQSVIRNILKANSHKWKNLRFAGSLPEWK